MAAGSWTLTEELFARGDATFVAELRSVHAPEQLGAFAAQWYADRRPFARQSLLEYLSLPLNSYRHEPLVKRLFKLAEAAKDDELMAVFLVAFDRALRRLRKTKTRGKFENFTSRAAAEVALREWEAQGFFHAVINEYSGRIFACATKADEVIVMPRDVMPRPAGRDLKKVQKLTDWQRQRQERKHLILFSHPTRRYLRRRAWRYFRVMGKFDPGRYVQNAARFLSLYHDDDADSDVQLLDNWGLMHTLFFNCPALAHPAKGWRFLPEKGLADLSFAPRFENAWIAQPELALSLLLCANCRPVRMFCIWLLRTKVDAWLRKQPAKTLLQLADHPDPEVAALGFDLLDASPDLASVPLAEWMRRLEGDDFYKLMRLSELLGRHLKPEQISLADTIRLSTYRSRPVAALGFGLLQAKDVNLSDTHTLLTLVNAECAWERQEIATWLREKLISFAPVESSWIIEFLDSKHADVRGLGWDWFSESPLKTDVSIWHKLMESPFPDVREKVFAMLTKVVESTDTNTLQFLWATVLCSIQRGSRQKPGVVQQIVARMAKEGSTAPTLLPLLAVAVRSLRGPEFRAGLTGVVMLSETKPELMPSIRQQFPELTL